MKGPEDGVVDRVAETISRYSMFPPCARVGVAVSGGADSVCLLDVLRELRGHWNLRLTVLHLNHLLRGAESDQDETFVRTLAERWGLPVIVERADVAHAAELEGENLEQAARTARRQFFRSKIEGGQLDGVAVGHTRTDQAETVLFRLLRGSYTTGLAGIRPVTREGIVRPLLDVTRSQVEQYLKDRGIEWREDSSNRSLQFARNRIRHELMPMLVSEWNPALPEILAAHATLAQEDEEYWCAEVDARAPELLKRGETGAVVTDVRSLSKLPIALARRVLRRAFEVVRGDLRRIDFSHVEEVLRLVQGGEGHARVQAPGVDVMRSFDWVRFAPPVRRPAERDWEFELPVPGQATIPSANTAVCAEIIESHGRSGATADDPHDTLKTELDWRRLQSAGIVSDSKGALLVLRNWRPGDAYRRAGDDHEYKIKTLFHDFRVPLWERRNWPVVTAGRRIIWSRRFGPAGDFAPDDSSDLLLQIDERQVAGS